MSSSSNLAERSQGRGPDRTLDDLLEHCATDDQAAFERLYALLAPRVYGLALRIAGQHSLAEEITQDVLTYVWTESGRFDRSRGSAVGWVLTIAHRRAVDRVRSVSASRSRDDVWTGKARSSPFDSTAESAHASIEAARVRGAVQALSLKQRSAIQLAYFNGLTHAEVATHLGIPQGTAKSRIRDGLSALAAALGPGASVTT